MNAYIRSMAMLAAFLVPIAGRAADPTPAEIRAAAARALPLIEASTKEYYHHRECFSCHHQAVPVYTLSLARMRGFAVDRDNLDEQLERTEADLQGAIDAYREGKGQGGGITRAGYALWTLKLGERPGNETTAAVAEFLVKNAKDRDHWKAFSKRPPTEGSDFTATFVALRGMQAFAPDGQRDAVAARSARARDWLLKAKAADTEDRVFRLRALQATEAGVEAIRAAALELTASQRPDGGWAQLADGSSDAYATGTVLSALHEAAAIAVNDPAYVRGLGFLLKQQRSDGSWYVKSRSRPFQPYFESGFPYEKDQFISMSASAWATAALLLTIPAAK